MPICILVQYLRGYYSANTPTSSTGTPEVRIIVHIGVLSLSLLLLQAGFATCLGSLFLLYVLLVQSRENVFQEEKQTTEKPTVDGEQRSLMLSLIPLQLMFVILALRAILAV